MLDTRNFQLKIKNNALNPNAKISFTVIQILTKYTKSKQISGLPVKFSDLIARAAYINDVSESEIIKSIDFMVDRKLLVDSNQQLTKTHGLDAVYIINPKLAREIDKETSYA